MISLRDFVGEESRPHPLYWLFRPSFWNSNDGISHEWSDALERIIDSVLDGDAEIIARSEYYAVIGSVHIWISNYPYAYGRRGPNGQQPRRCTRVRLAKLIAAYDLLLAQKMRSTPDAALKEATP